jgi:ribosomal protein L37AE/L43A
MGARLNLLCPSCGVTNLKRLNRLAGVKAVACNNCGKGIDLCGKATQVFIQNAQALYGETRRLGKTVKVKSHHSSAAAVRETD